MTQLSDGVDPEWAVLMSPSDRALDTPKNTPKNTPPDTPQKPPQKGGSRGGENPGGKFRENFPGPGGPGPARPGRPARGSPGAPRDTPPGRPILGPNYGLFIQKWGKSTPRRDPARGALLAPPGGGCKKCTFFWVFNNSPSRDSLVTFFRFFRSRGVPGNPPKPPPGTPPGGGCPGGVGYKVQSSPDGQCLYDTPDAVCPA